MFPDFRPDSARKAAQGDTNGEDFIYGINSVESLLATNPSRIHRIIFLQGSKNSKLHALQNSAKKLKLHTQQLPEKRLSFFTANHQGVIAFCHQKDLMTWDELKPKIPSSGPCLLVMLDGMEDPHNLGACIRSSLALNAQGMLLRSKGTCALNKSTAKSASGALESMNICRPASLELCFEELKEMGFKFSGLEAGEETLLHDGLKSDRLVLIGGSEDRGVPAYLRKWCDEVLSIPMNPDAHSFNASVALSLGLYEWNRNQLSK